MTRQDRIRRLEQELQETALAHQGSEESRLRMTQELDEAREELASLRQLQGNGLPTQSQAVRIEAIVVSSSTRKL